jgi:transcriptional regulator with XRE-family HTH domain
MASLGQELKEARESRGISLREISQATHIGMRFLQAIENDQFEQLPGGIFNRSFVRKYARQVGLDEEQVSSRFEQVMAERGVEPPKTSVNYLEDFEDRPSSGRFWLPALIFIILAAGAYAAYQYSTSTGTDPNPVAAASPTPVATPTVSPTPTPTPEAPSDIRLRLVAANGDCWMRIATDEAPPLTKILKAGETEDFVATNRLVVNLGNVQAVTAEINGRPMKLEPNNGKTGLRNVILTKETYQQYLQ